MGGRSILVVVNPAVAGPSISAAVVVRPRIHVNPRTAQVTVSSDPFADHSPGYPAGCAEHLVTDDRPTFHPQPTTANRWRGREAIIRQAGFAPLPPIRQAPSGRRACRGPGLRTQLALRMTGGTRPRAERKPEADRRRYRREGEADISPPLLYLPSPPPWRSKPHPDGLHQSKTVRG